jgi:hypothetical protein
MPLPLVIISFHSLLVDRSPSALRCTKLETILRLACYEFEGSHAAGACGLSPLRFLAPVIYMENVSHLSRLEMFVQR